MCPRCANTPMGISEALSMFWRVQLAGPQGQGMAGDGLLAAFTSWPIPIAGVLAYHLPGIGSHSKSKMSPTEELAWRAVTQSL